MDTQKMTFSSSRLLSSCGNLFNSLRCFYIYLKVQIQIFHNGTFIQEVAPFHVRERLWGITSVKVLEGSNQIISHIMWSPGNHATQSNNTERDRWTTIDSPQF